MGRPTKCTPEVTVQIADAISAGAYAQSAAALAGIGERTYYSWMERGESGEEPYAQFRQAVRRAEAEAEQESIAVVRGAAGQGSWQAAAWYLERKFPSRWGRGDRTNVANSGRTAPLTLASLHAMMLTERHDG